MPTPIQEEPESTVGRKPEHPTSPRQPEPEYPTRSGSALRREEGDETEAAGEIREREKDEPAPERGLEE
jgi:hypothetical protein